MPDQPHWRFRPIAADPYAFPFDGRWSSADTALLLLGFQQGQIATLGAGAEFETALGIAARAQARGLFIVASRRSAISDGDLPARLVLPDTALVVEHAGDNAFYDTPLEEALRARGIRNLLIAGLPTDGLVHATQRAANDMGFECLAIADACRGTSAARHIAQLRITTFGNGLFGTVASAAAVHAALTPA